MEGERSCAVAGCVQRSLSGDPKLVRDWMRGRHTAEEIVEMLATGDDLPIAELKRIVAKCN